MSGDEILVYMLFIVLSVVYLFQLLKYILERKSIVEKRLEKNTIFFTLVLSVLFFYIIIKKAAAYDVVGKYVMFYIVFGVAWIYLFQTLLMPIFDFSWRDDIFGMKNKSALITYTSIMVSFALIYGGANIGDGPGWWCVLIAGILGMIVWFLIFIISNIANKIFYRITVERSFPTGIRFAMFSISISIILARACGGDWTSFVDTIKEFYVAWPVIPMMVVFLLIDKAVYKIEVEKNTNEVTDSLMTLSIGTGIIFIVISLLYSLMYLPSII